MSNEESETERVLRALEKAVNRVKVMQTDFSSKVRAVDTFCLARSRLERGREDGNKMNTFVLLIFINKKRRSEIREVLERNHLLCLNKFAKVPFVLIQAVFRYAGVTCPLELRSFHEAYQEN